MLTNITIFQICASHKSKYIFNDSLKSNFKKHHDSVPNTYFLNKNIFLMKELYTVPMQIFISVNNDDHYKNAS